LGTAPSRYRGALTAAARAAQRQASLASEPSVADLRAGGGEADDQASVLGALLGPGGGGSGAGLARRDSGSSFRSSRLGPLDDMVLEAGLQARGRAWVRGFRSFLRLSWPLVQAPPQGGGLASARRAAGQAGARAPGTCQPPCRVGLLLRHVGMLQPARLCWPGSSIFWRPLYAPVP
jgi:hypothetical protein